MKTNFEELRLIDEFGYLIKKYPNIAFNIKNWNQERNLPSDGKKHLFVTEGVITIPENFDEKIILEYDTYIINNIKIFNLFKDKINCILLRHPLRYQHYYRIDNFVNYKNKINGILSIQNYYNPPNPMDVSIIQLRDIFMSNNILSNNFQMDSYGPNFYGGSSYRGHTEATLTNFKNLEMTSKYKFRFCPEPIYHELWSYDYITERLFACFETKTIPIYIGGYNVEEFVPKDFFIDLRKYADNYGELCEKLNSISEKDYIEITEEAFLWQKNNKMGSMDYAEEVFMQLK